MEGEQEVRMMKGSREGSGRGEQEARKKRHGDKITE